MIRIDENTYIDDTLVTCAEYQLFIDEMREQGKYYQPDHWTSYQFQEGQAHAPILGIRRSDAKIFCEWLSSREAGRWFFRLPTLSNAKEYPLTKPAQPPLGYWIGGKEGEAQFAWVGSIPVNPRNINKDFLNPVAINPAQKHNLTRSGALALEFAGDRDLELARTLISVLDRDLELSIARASLQKLTIALYRIQTLNVVCFLSYDRVRALNLELALDFDRALDLEPTFEHAFLLSHSINRDFYRENYRTLYMEINSDIYTLQERIAGRSPAFEGIRIVKERKKP